ncbi:MAG: LptA/OstA family protein [Roseinatronobacter monicus]
MRSSGVVRIALLLTAFSANAVSAQGTGLSFSGLDAVRGLPVEITSDELQVDNTTGETVFSGNAVLGQGDMRIAAPLIRIIYASADGGRIERLEASGGVTLVTAQEAAESQDAVYAVEDGTVTMQGSVILTQGPNVLSGDRLNVNVRTGQGRMDGNVRTIIQTNP